MTSEGEGLSRYRRRRLDPRVKRIREKGLSGSGRRGSPWPGRPLRRPATEPVDGVHAKVRREKVEEVAPQAASHAVPVCQQKHRGRRIRRRCELDSVQASAIVGPKRRAHRQAQELVTGCGALFGRRAAKVLARSLTRRDYEVGSGPAEPRPRSLVHLRLYAAPLSRVSVSRAQSSEGLDYAIGGHSASA